MILKPVSKMFTSFEIKGILILLILILNLIMILKKMICCENLIPKIYLLSFRPSLTTYTAAENLYWMRKWSKHPYHSEEAKLLHAICIVLHNI